MRAWAGDSFVDCDELFASVRHHIVPAIVGIRLPAGHPQQAFTAGPGSPDPGLIVKAPCEVRGPGSGLTLVGLFPVCVVVHLRDDEPCAVALALQDPEGVVVPDLDLPATHELLPLHL